MKLKNKILLIICVVTALLLCSCGGNMTDESVQAELERLLPLSYEMNEIFWGEGLPYKDNGSNNIMKPVTDDCGYKSTEDILNKASEIFSDSYMEIIKDAIFTDSDDIDPRYKDINDVLKIDTSNKGFNIQGNIDISSAKIKKQNKGMVVVSAQYEDGGNTEITLVLQDGQWYLDSPTY